MYKLLSTGYEGFTKHAWKTSTTKVPPSKTYPLYSMLTHRQHSEWLSMKCETFVYFNKGDQTIVSKHLTKPVHIAQQLILSTEEII